MLKSNFLSFTRSHEEGIGDEIMEGVRKHYKDPVVIGEDLMQIEIAEHIVLRKNDKIILREKGERP